MSNLFDSLVRTATISSCLSVSCSKLMRLWWKKALSIICRKMSSIPSHGATNVPSFMLEWRLLVANFTWTCLGDFSRNVSCSSAKIVVVTTFQFLTTKSSNSLVAWSVVWRKRSNLKRSWNRRRSSIGRLWEMSKSSSMLRLNSRWTVNYFWISYTFYEVAACFAPQAASAGPAVVCVIWWQTSIQALRHSKTGPTQKTSKNQPMRLRWIQVQHFRSNICEMEWETMAR